MNKRYLSILAIVAILLGVANSLMLVRQSAGAARLSAPSVPQLISYQGRLTDAAGNPLTGDYDMRFCLYAEPAGGSTLWCETYAAVNGTTIAVTDGVFTVLLGSIAPIPEALFDGADLYLGVKVGSDDEMTPRRRIASAPYAIRAAMAVDADTVDGMHAGDLESAGAVSTHATDPNAHHTRYADAEAVAAIKAADGTGSGLDADMVDGIHASISPEANKLLPLDTNAKLPASVVPFKVYDSGWFAVAQNQTYIKTHNLGTLKAIWAFYFSENNNDTSVYIADVNNDPGYNEQTGAYVKDVTTTQLTLVTTPWNIMVGDRRYTSGYMRIIGLALE